VVGSIGDARASSSGGLEVFGSAERKLAVGTGRDVDAIGLLLLGAIGKLAGFGGGLLLSLRGISAQPRSIGGLQLSTFSFSFWAFFRAFLEGPSGCCASAAGAAGGGASLIVLWVMKARLFAVV
jgi:hypothetical protein